MNKDDNEALNFQLQRVFAALSRNILTLLEDLKVNHNNNFDKLRVNLPLDLENLVDMSDYFDENTYAYYRKKVLDQVMSAKRDLEFAVNNNK